MKKTIYKLIQWINNLILASREKRAIQKLAQDFTTSYDKESNERQISRLKVRNEPNNATVYDYLFGFGLNPSPNDLEKIEEVAAQCRANGWKNISSRYLAAILTSKYNLEQVLYNGLDDAILKVAGHHFGTIRKPVKPGRNSICLCGSGLKYKKCCHLKVMHSATAIS
ncbi:hypothetical protein JCM19294_1122 [Nonlabens tegetincola]|uniref:SEC-C domain-containing protein n=1 Tax=Nonlabens tegetincola TaxID=323273 RepID=A0A090Q4Z1_9FLAO|nr:SEC-C metal-binding domain-containing protein [Nonlabens tegetincola]GAK96813.1 hypothetical protein JCM19294_1122 [Nonlabens tegetincola]